jgi:hypothetical protein
MSFGRAIAQLSEMGIDEITAIQQQLIDAGQLRARRGENIEDLLSGEPDDRTLRAYTNVMRMAYRSKTTFSDVLAQETAKTAKAGGGRTTSVKQGIVQAGVRGTGGAHIIDLSNPADINMVADHAARNFLGRGATAEEKAKLVASIQGQETEEQGKRIGAQEDMSKADFEAKKGMVESDFQARVGSRDAAMAARNQAGGSGSGVTAIITKVAQELGVDPKLAIAIARQESGLDPRSVGDNGTSFGLFQLHRGGELGNMSPEQAYDPETNARTALSQVAAVAKQHPDWSPGKIAAAAQRPADQAGYAKSVDALYGGGGGPGRAATVVAGEDKLLPSEYTPGTTTKFTKAPSAGATAREQMTGVGSPTRLQYGAHLAATSVYDAMIRAIRNPTGSVSESGAAEVGAGE